MGDESRVASLIEELGYPSAPATIRPRLNRVGKERCTVVLVAEVGGQLVGLATAHAFYAIHQDEAVAYLSALVVSSTGRRQGVGQALVTRIEQWAQDQGARRLSLVTGAQRVDSHRFYEALGYSKAGFRYSRLLNR